MEDKKSYLILKEKNLYKAFLILALPVFFANLLKSVHDLVDTYFIGGLENSVDAQAGISITWPLINIFLSFSVGLSIAGVALISQLIGAKKEENAKKYAAVLVTLSLIIGLIVTVLLYFTSPLIMRLMGATGGTYDCAVIYLQIRAFEMPFLFTFTAYQAIRQARGDTLTPVILSIIAVVINIILTAVFVKEYDMGVAGAALATLIGQALIVPVCFYKLFKKKNDFKINFKDLKPEREDVFKIAKFATPSAISQALASLGFLILQGFILSYGDETAAAFSLGNKISNLLLLPIMALGSILAAYVGQNIGARNKDRAKQAYKTSKTLSLVISIVGVLILIPIRHSALGLLTNDNTTLEIASEYVIWVLITQPLMGLFQNYLGVFNGSGNTSFSFIMATVRLWLIRLPMLLIMKNIFEMDRSCIWITMNVSNLLILFLGAYLYKKVDYEPKIKVNKIEA